MLPVLPFHVAIPNLLKRRGLETRCDSQFTQPCINIEIDAVRCRVSDDKTQERVRTTKRAQRLENQAKISEIGCGHGVICFSAALCLTDIRKGVACGRQLLPDWCKHRFGEHIVQNESLGCGMLRAR